MYQNGTTDDIWPSRHVQTFNVRPGYYQLQVFLAGYRPFERSLEIYGDAKDLRIVLSPEGEATGERRINGKVVNAKNYEQLWVVAFPLNGNPSDMIQGLVSGTGTFQIGTIHPGPYVLTVVQGDNLLTCKGNNILDIP
jgi:hypothetical protein